MTSCTTSTPVTWLFTPATARGHLDTARRVGADIGIIDLEDSVAPADKDEARDAAIRHLESVSDTGGLAIRVNTSDSPTGRADLAALAASQARPGFVVVPKVESPRHLEPAADITCVVAMIESAAGVQNLPDVVGGDIAPAALLFGAADMAGDLGCSPASAVMTSARSRILITAATRAVPVIDTPWFDHRDVDGLRRAAAEAVGEGFAAKAAIHPSQIAIIEDAFTPTADQISHAQNVIETSDRGVGSVDGQMVDEALARSARRILARARSTTPTRGEEHR